MKKNPINTYLRRNYKGIYYTVSEAAPLVGKSSDTLKRWRRQGFFTPSKTVMMGEVKVYLYTEDDIERLKILATKTERGRPLDMVKK